MFLPDEKSLTGKFVKWLNGWALEVFIVAPILFGLFLLLALLYDPVAVRAGLLALVGLSPFWLPPLLAVGFWISWIEYIRLLNWLKLSQNYITLEVQLPPDVTKSPLAMEVFFNGVSYSGGEATFWKRMWDGSFIAHTSFEIASNEGKIGFYIRCWKPLKDFIESRLYGQYPEIKIREVPDYTERVQYNPDTYNAWVTDFRKSNDTHALPIKTYDAYELDKDTTTPETKIDPLTQILEVMNGLGKDQYLWLQFITKTHKNDQWYGIYSDPKQDTYKTKAKEQINKILKDAAERTANLVTDEAEKKKVAARAASLLTEDEKDSISAIERSLSKTVYEVGIRAVYIAKKDKYVGLTAPAMVRFFEPFKSFNGLAVTRGLIGFDFWWEDFGDWRQETIKKLWVQMYKERAYFYVPIDQVPTFLTTEELASLWHFPGSAVKTPGLNRVEARTAEPPTGLPTLPS